MRTELKKITNQERHRFIGTVSKFGFKAGWYAPEQTILLTNIKLYDEDKIITDHLWFTMGKQFSQLNLKEGDIISFEARVGKYRKGYYGNIDYFFEKNGYFPPRATIEYKLERPTKIKLEN